MKKAAFMAFAMAGMLSGSVMAQDDGAVETEEVTEKNACSGNNACSAECKDAADKEACMAKSSESSEKNGCGENGCG